MDGKVMVYYYRLTCGAVIPSLTKLTRGQLVRVCPACHRECTVDGMASRSQIGRDLQYRRDVLATTEVSEP